MLKLTKKADYALMAMKHLAECSSMGSRSAKDVSDAYGIPPEALAKILQRLAKAGLPIDIGNLLRMRPNRLGRGRGLPPMPRNK